MKNIKLKITGIKDNISKEKLINKLKEKKGIKNVEFNIPEKILSITYNKINKTKIEDYLDDLDIKSEGIIEDLFEKEETFLGQNIILGLLGVLYSIIYSWLYIIPNILISININIINLFLFNFFILPR